MKPSFLVIAGLVLGLGVGIGLALNQLSGSTPSVLVPAKVRFPEVNPNAPTFLPEDGPQPKLELDHTTHNFGAMEKGEKRSHVFVFKNVGQHPLTLVKGETTCKCTLSSLGDGDGTRVDVEPGGQLDIKLDWEAKDDSNANFRQTAVIFTNDRDRDRVVLTIEGRIESSINIVPAAMQAGELSRGETKVVETRLMTNRTDDLQITSHKWLAPDTADFFSVEIIPAPPEQRQQLGARSLVLVKVTIKPGHPTGELAQGLELTTNLEGVPPQSVPILGSVLGNMSVVGGNYMKLGSNRGVINLGSVAKGEGVQRTLKLLLRGPARGEVKPRVATVRPEALQVTLGEPRALNENVSEIPVTIAIPKDAPTMRYSGKEGSGETARYSEENSALVVIDSDHPDYGQQKLLIQCAVGR